MRFRSVRDEERDGDWQDDAVICFMVSNSSYYVCWYCWSVLRTLCGLVRCDATVRSAVYDRTVTLGGGER